MFEDLIEMVNNSNLLPEDKEIWHDVFKLLDRDQLRAIYESIDGQDQRLKFMTENIKKKMDAIKNQDRNLMGNILEEEKQDLATA